MKGIKMDNRTQANKKVWDELAETHIKKYHIERLLSGTPLLNEVIRQEVGEVRDKSLIHLLCHIGSDTLSWALLGARVTGVDISPQSLKYARQLAVQMGIQADFIEADIMEVKDRVKDKFDIVFSSTGVLCWIPDLHRYAQTVRSLLHDDGFFYLYDGHPFRNVFLNAEGSADTTTIVQGDYFRKEVWRYEKSGDYTDPTLLLPNPSYEWNWTMGEIVSAFCDAGLRIVFLHEFPQYFYSGYTPYDVSDNKVELFPCTFSLKAQAIASSER